MIRPQLPPQIVVTVSLLNAAVTMALLAHSNGLELSQWFKALLSYFLVGDLGVLARMWRLRREHGSMWWCRFNVCLSWARWESGIRIDALLGRCGYGTAFGCCGSERNYVWEVRGPPQESSCVMRDMYGGGFGYVVLTWAPSPP
jgi:hypothetical protein